ncbi:unnamed protein product [Chrysoparadoxa australica]
MLLRGWGGANESAEPNPGNEKQPRTPELPKPKVTGPTEMLAAEDAVPVPSPSSSSVASSGVKAYKQHMKRRHKSRIASGEISKEGRRPSTSSTSSKDVRRPSNSSTASGKSAGGSLGAKTGVTVVASPMSSGSQGTQYMEEDEDDLFISDWSKQEGETDVMQAARLYLSNLDPNRTHEDNVELLLRQVLEHLALSIIHPSTKLTLKHHIKIGAALRSVTLAVPPRTWKQGLAGAIGLGGVTGLSPKGAGMLQISQEDLLYRLDLFVVGMQELQSGRLKHADLDNMRVEGVMRAFVANSGQMIQRSGSSRSTLPPLLLCMAGEIICVRVLGHEVQEVVRKIVSDYKSRCKMLLTPSQNAERFLRPLIAEFAAWIRVNQDVLYYSSATEALLRCINSKLRYRLKNQVYQSHEHFMAVFASLRPYLVDIPLPPYDPMGSEDKVTDEHQTLKDIQRERFCINGAKTSPALCLERLTEVVNDALNEAVLNTTATGDSSSVSDLSDEDESDSAQSQGKGFNHEGEEEKAYVSQCVWKVLHAASRTASGGDSFFIVQDLFGGEGVLLKTARVASPPIRIRSKGLVVKVTTTNCYDIYHMSDVDEEGSSPYPLMTVKTVMKELITFQQFHPRHVKKGEDAAAGVSPSLDEEEFVEHGGRFLTISADKPTYARDHLEGISKKVISRSVSGEGGGENTAPSTPSDSSGDPTNLHQGTETGKIPDPQAEAEAEAVELQREQGEDEVELTGIKPDLAGLAEMNNLDAETELQVKRLRSTHAQVVPIHIHTSNVARMVQAASLIPKALLLLTHLTCPYLSTISR